MSVGYLFARGAGSGRREPDQGEPARRPSNSGDLVGNGIVPLSFSKDSHAAYRGVGITTVDQGVQDYIGTTYVSDAGDGAGRAVHGRVRWRSRTTASRTA